MEAEAAGPAGTARETGGEPHWLDPDEQELWRTALTVIARASRRLDEELGRTHGLSFGEYEVLVHLSEAPDGSLRMRDLAYRVALSPSGLTRRVTRLAGRGLVRREACPSDRRGLLAVITPAGTEAIAAAAPTHVEGVRRYVMDLVPAASRDEIRRALADMLGALEGRKRVSPFRAR